MDRALVAVTVCIGKASVITFGSSSAIFLGTSAITSHHRLLPKAWVFGPSAR